MKRQLTKPEHEAFYQDMAVTLKKYDHLPIEELLAIASNFIGKMVALQDQRRYTAPMIMEIIALNIEEGNKQMISKLMKSKGNA